MPGLTENDLRFARAAGYKIPWDRAEWEYKTKVGVAEALAKSTHPLVPEIMMAGDSKGGAENAMDAVGLNMLMDLTDKLSKK